MRHKYDEEQLEQQRMEWLTGYTGGEFESAPWDGVSAYWVGGVPDWAATDFPDRRDFDVEYRTAIWVDCHHAPEIGSQDPTGEWTLVRYYSGDREIECPVPENHDGAKVTREQSRLVKRWPKGKRAECVMCEKRIGSEHGYLYAGNIVEAVYRRGEDTDE